MNLVPFAVLRRSAAVLVVSGAVAAAFAHPAEARVFVGIGFPFFAPYYAPPPVYYPPPVVYAPPPPVVYAPPPAYSAAPSAYPGQSCYAGQYTCPMERPVAPGAGCYCLGNGGQRVAGRAS